MEEKETEKCSSCGKVLRKDEGNVWYFGKGANALEIVDCDECDMQNRREE